ncbi:MAG TPA: hypothetical protein VIJ68_03535 [Candidatus Saccharimonadales bacterium]
MPLTSEHAFLEKVSKDPPVKLGYHEVRIPEDVDFTFIGADHDIRFDTADYLQALLLKADVFFCEEVAWTPPAQENLQHIANKDFRALQRQQSIADREIKSQHWQNVYQTKWAKAVYSALYGSQVQVVFADYPANHPEIESGGVARYRQAFAQWQNNESPEVNSYPVFLRRDSYILRAICDSIAQLRTEAGSKLTTKSPLRVLALYGGQHLGVFDALMAGARSQGVESMHGRAQFSACDIDQLDSELRKKYEEYDDRTAQYLNWLRVPEEQTS